MKVMVFLREKKPQEICKQHEKNENYQHFNKMDILISNKGKSLSSYEK